SGTFGLAQSDGGAGFRAQLQFADIDLDQGLGELIGLRRVEGKGTLAFNLDSTGGSVYEIAQGMNGTVSLASAKGAIAGINVEQLPNRLERNPRAGRPDSRSGKTPYDTLALPLKAAQGTATIDYMRVETPGVRLTLTGSASLPARDLDLKGTASLMPARDAAATFELPFLVTGPWDNPLIWPDAQALISHSGAAAPLLDPVPNRLNPRPSPDP